MLRNRIFNIARRSAGTLFEVLFIAFLTFANVSGANHERHHDTKSDFTLSALENNPIVLKDNQERVFTGNILESQSLDWEFYEVISDLHVVCISKHKLFFLNVFQRSAYYIFNSASAP